MMHRRDPRSLLIQSLILLWLLVVLAGKGVTMAETHGTDLPEGKTGIAAKYPGDQGIEDDPDVIFVEKFDEDTLEAIEQRWDTMNGKNIMALSSDVPQGSADGQSLELTHIGGEGTGGQLYRRLLPGYERLFARFYVKFHPDCAPIHHFGTHLGGFEPPTPWPQGGAGIRPDGAKRFTTGVEPYGNRWEWDFYTYWQGMHVHGDGNYWGTPFLSGAPKHEVVRGKWICVEMMLQMNQPVEESNGEQAFWIDGQLWRVDGQVVSHVGQGFPKGEWSGGWWQPSSQAETTFEGFQWRSIEKLATNYVWTYLYITKAPAGHVSKVWYDNIVIARNYIGPISQPQ